MPTKKKQRTVAAGTLHPGDKFRVRSLPSSRYVMLCGRQFNRNVEQITGSSVDIPYDYMPAAEVTKGALIFVRCTVRALKGWRS